MSDPGATVRDRAKRAIAEALTRVAGQPGLAALERELREAHQRLAEPMTVALVGRIKTGKSTMANALLGAELAPTASTVCTYNVNWFHAGPAPTLSVHYKDARPPERREFGELEALTRHREDHREQLIGIDYLEIRHPTQLLCTFSLVDTPGLGSAEVSDSDNALRFLGMQTQEVTERTENEARKADAVLYLFTRTLAAWDASTVEEFSGPVFGQASPINAIGVLTKFNNIYKDVEDPRAGAEQIARRLLHETPAGRLFYAIVPVCGLLALGARMLTDAEYESLSALATLPDDELRKLVARPRRFIEHALPGSSPETRRTLIGQRLGQYGVLAACRTIRDDGVVLEDLRPRLLAQSGMHELENLIVSHFGNRASIIKLERIVRDIRALCFRAQLSEIGAAGLAAASEVDELFEAIEIETDELVELRVLRSNYDGGLDFTKDESEELMQVTGELGTSTPARLGAADDAAPDELSSIAEGRIRYWRMRASDIAASTATQGAARVLARSYERLLDRVEQLPESRVLKVQAGRKSQP